MLIQWEGSAVDLCLSHKEGREPTKFNICENCYDDIICGEREAEKVLIPSGYSEPQDKYLYVSDWGHEDECEICRGSV
jgi:hypothetical protein